SAPSQPVSQKAPGEISQQLILKKQETQNGVKLTWTLPVKKKTERMLIYKATGDSPIKLLDNTTEDAYIDRNADIETTCRYRIKAVYDDGSFSELSNEVTVKK
ncbi:MAG: hypothetical protein LBH19_01620, partial [Dysgonamonadaceae bacterium]|nr:hypothetical protein [Dysgonamonadaceae bacterium]